MHAYSILRRFTWGTPCLYETVHLYPCLAGFSAAFVTQDARREKRAESTRQLGGIEAHRGLARRQRGREAFRRAP